MKDIKEITDKMNKKVNAVIYPKKKINEDILEDKAIDINNLEDIEILEKNKNAYLYILPYLGTDRKIYKSIKEQAKDNMIYIVTLQNDKHSPYVYRQKYEQISTVYDLTTFLDNENWISFIQYILQTRKIEKIFLSNTKYNLLLLSVSNLVKAKLFGHFSNVLPWQ